MGLIVSCVGEEKEQASPTIEEEEEEEEEDAGGDVFDSNETCEQIVRALVFSLQEKMRMRYGN